MATSRKLVYSKLGNPAEVLSIVEEPVPTELKAGSALIKVLYSPVNQLDYHIIAGHFPIKQTLPATIGTEGVAEVVKSSTGNFQPGDHVLVGDIVFGMWREMGVADEKSLTKMPKELPAEVASTFSGNPFTAYVMFKTIVPLEAGDALIQSAANSAVATNVIQFCKLAGVKTINVVRNRANLQELVDKLKGIGADAVVTDEQLKEGLDKLNLGLPAPKLALDAVGGSGSANLVAALADGGTLAQYGNLSGQPSLVGGSDLIFRDIKICGFSIPRWMATNPAQIPKFVGEVADMFIQGKVKPPTFKIFGIDDYKEAVNYSVKGFTNEKVLFKLN